MTAIRFPAEWEPQAAVWLAWPHNTETWPTRHQPNQASRHPLSRNGISRWFDRIPPFYCRWVRLITEDTPVRILGRPGQAEFRQLQSPDIDWVDIDWVDIATNDCWIRDYGPTFVFQDEDSTPRLRAIDWRYNAWGGKYPPWDDDDAAAARIGRHLGIPVLRDDLCLEGGALETDGNGRLLTTTSCLVTPTRNPNHSRDQIEQQLRLRLGVTEIVWLDGGLAGDDTDGHIDQLVRFIDAENIVVAATDDTSDVNFAPLARLHQQLCRWAAATQPRVSVHRLPLPPPRTIDGQRVPESYCNFLWLGRKRLLVPTFGQPGSDDRAMAMLRELAAGTEIVGVDCKDMVWGLGALHCASREQPAGREQPDL